MPGLTQLALDGAHITSEQLLSLQEEAALETLTIWGGPVTNAQLAPIRHLIQLKNLTLGEMPIDDGVFAHLQPLRHLESLNLAYTNVQGLMEALSGLPLRDVRLEGCRRVGDACATVLAGFPTLRHLEIHMTGLTDRGVMQLAELPLEVLWLGPRITDAGMAAIGSISTLRHLDLCAHLVTDEGVRAISGIPGLTILWLSRCRITDDSLPVLSSMRRLRELNVQHTDVTPQGMAELQRLLPDCRLVEAD